MSKNQLTEEQKAAKKAEAEAKKAAAQAAKEAAGSEKNEEPKELNDYQKHMAEWESKKEKASKCVQHDEDYSSHPKFAKFKKEKG